jgi:hypothetical protein
MGVQLALPLFPVVVSSGPAATAAAATFFIGSTLHLADTLYGFRRSAPTLPPLTGLEGVATLREMVADALAGARVPVGFPLPPPWRPEGSALGLAAAALGVWGSLTNGLGQLWGWLNGRESTGGADGWFGPAAPNVQPLSIVTGQGDGSGFMYPELSGLPPGAISIPWVPDNAVVSTWLEVTTSDSYADAVYFKYGFLDSAGIFQTKCVQFGFADACIPLNSASLQVNGWVRVGQSGYQPEVPASSPGPLQPLIVPQQLQANEGSSEPGTGLLAPAPLSLPAPAPATAPRVVPEVQPAVSPVEPGPQPKAPPLTLPAPYPLPLPGGDPSRVTVQNGALPAAAPLPVPTTDPGSIIPWPGAAPIPGTGPAPAPTLQGIAQEVGRIERKIEVMMSPNAPGNLVDKFDLLDELLKGLIGAIIASESGTTYSLDSPCEVDADGVKLPPVLVEAPGALTQFGAVLNRLDALAELVQVHKNLKQPNCKPKPPTGEFVTVNFEQID